ncbi:MAG: N-acetylmuramoyl-L-alanine amidase [Erysipelotrichaceae bacterium]
MKYEARKKRKLTPKIIILLTIVLFVLTLIAYQTLKPKEIKQGITICSYDINKTSSTLATQYKDTFEINDYLYYGESLNLYAAKYNPGTNDKIAGATLVLKNLCTQEESYFTANPLLDQQIPLDELKEGYYEVFINDLSDLKKKRLIYNGKLDSTFTTITRNGKRYDIKLIADPELYKSETLTMDKSYIFISVKESTNKEEYYDIVLDPFGNDQDFTLGINLGNKANGLIEAEETYNSAILLKTKLEEKGYKVLITRKDKDDVINTYGEEGRLSLAYKYHAKYYIQLAMNASNYDYVRGTEIQYSAYSSKNLANAILFDLKKDTPLVMSSVYSKNESDNGLIQSSLVKGEDGRAIYDNNMFIRELGGIGTQAGTYSKTSRSNTFAKDNIYGVESLIISYGYLTNKEDVEVWNNNKDKIIEVTANAIDKKLATKVKTK